MDSKQDEQGRFYVDTILRDVIEGVVIRVMPDGTLREYNTRPVLNLSSEREEYNTQKPIGLIELLIDIASNKDSIVADFFVGSGTTAKAATRQNRKFIAGDIGINSIQTSRDGVAKLGADLDLLKIKDGIRLFRNPAQTQAKVFSLIDGFSPRTQLGLGEFWDGGIAKGSEFIPVKFIPIHDRLTKESLAVLLEEIYALQDVKDSLNTVKLIYAHRDPDITQAYIDKEIRDAAKTTIKVELTSLDELLGAKRDMLFMPDSAEIEVKQKNNGCIATIKRFFSPYLKAKIDEFNAKKVKKDGQEPVRVKISESGLELIEAVQFDTTLKKAGVWTSNLELEDKAGVKDQIKGIYELPVKKFKIKIRNIAGDEIVLDSNSLA
jgi:adenine-specific DNA-methyltransferase